MLHVPDKGPGKRVPGAGARTEGREASRQSSEVGAVCRKAARTVLCGGRPVMGVPTAIDEQATCFDLICWPVRTRVGIVKGRFHRSSSRSQPPSNVWRKPHSGDRGVGLSALKA
jgi:hypothetical protein